MKPQELREEGVRYYEENGPSKAIEKGYELGLEDDDCPHCGTEQPHFENEEGRSECFICGQSHMHIPDTAKVKAIIGDHIEFIERGDGNYYAEVHTGSNEGDPTYYEREVKNKEEAEILAKELGNIDYVVPSEFYDEHGKKGQVIFIQRTKKLD